MDLDCRGFSNKVMKSNVDWGARFISIGENVHTTRVLLRKGKSIVTHEDRESISYKGLDNETKYLVIPEAFKERQEYKQGQIKHVMIAVTMAMSGKECSEPAIDYLHTLARKQDSAQASYLDVNVDEISYKLDEQKRAMRWLVESLQQISSTPLSIDSSNIEVIEVGLAAYNNDMPRPLLNSATLERLDAIDDAIVLGSPRILSMIEEVTPMRDIEPVVAEIERRQERRFGALQGMIEMLGERGWDVSGMQTGLMHEQFAEAERIHALDGQLTQCQRQIENEIRPFGHNVAERLWGAVSMAQKEASAEAVNQVRVEVEDKASDLASRLAQVEGRIASWQSEGFEFRTKLPLLASEMIAWEAKLPKIGEQIEATHGIWAQMEPHLAQWPE